MLEHAGDILMVVTWALVSLGGLLVSGLIYFGKKVIERFDTQDATLVGIRDILSKTEGKLVEMIHSHEVRLSIIEKSCQLFHGGPPGQNNRDEPRRIAFPDYPD